MREKEKEKKESMAMDKVVQVVGGGAVDEDGSESSWGGAGRRCIRRPALTDSTYFFLLYLHRLLYPMPIPFH